MPLDPAYDYEVELREIECKKQCFKFGIDQNDDDILRIIYRMRTAEEKIRKMTAVLEIAYDLLKAWELWESDIILDDRSWDRELPTLTENQFNTLVPGLQDARNKALASVRDALGRKKNA